MDKLQAQKLIKDTFENRFDKERFVNFVRNLFNHIEEDTFNHRGNLIVDAYKQYISTFERIGKYQDKDEKTIDILIVNLKKTSSLDRARTMQRNFVARYLNGSRGGKLKDAALVAFVSPDNDDWRFSLIKMDYKFDKKGRVREEFTPARRFSFLVGKNENSHTAQSQLVPILVDDEYDPSLGRLEQAFNIESVTKEFFTKYKELFEIIVRELDKNHTFKNEASKNNIITENFAKKLLGQIVFLYFLQKKGWLGIKAGQSWGDGDKSFLRHLFEDSRAVSKNFFNDYLEILFYDTLNNPRRNTVDPSFSKYFNCRIPFLNGGLFEPEYDWQNSFIYLDDYIFEKILNVFDLYNFTVKEDEPLEKEVAVDPEMLGKVFENLLEENLRKGKGTYYTPREIVRYMCQESLINHLVTETKTPEKKIRTLVTRDMVLTKEDILNAQNSKDDNSKVVDKILVFWEEEAKELDKIMQGNSLLEELVLGDTSIKLFDTQASSRKRGIKKQELHEVFQDRLSLGGKKIHEDGQDALLEKYKKLQINFFNESDHELKKTIKQRLSKIETDLIEQSVKGELENLEAQNKGLGNYIIPGLGMTKKDAEKFQKNLSRQAQIMKVLDEFKKSGVKPFFLWKLYFADVFENRGGFDIVIANPPYVSYGLRGGQTMTAEEKKMVKEIFPNSAEYKISLYAIFMDKAIQLAKNKGIQAFIVPDSFLLGRYFSKIRRFILDKNNIIEFLLLPYNVFDATVGFSLIYLFQKNDIPDKTSEITAKTAFSNNEVAKNDFKQFSYPQEYFEGLKYNRFRLFFDQDTMDLVTKIESNAIPLGDVIDFNSGLIGNNGKKSIVSDEKKTKDWLPGIISGGEIQRYILKPDGYFLLYKKDKIHSGFDCVNYFEDKIFMRQTGDSLISAIDDIHLLCLNNVHVGNLKDKKYSLKYVTAVINSVLMNYYYKSLALEGGRAMAQTDIETIESLPIKEADEKQQKSITALVDKIMALTKADDYMQDQPKQKKVQEYQRQIDQLVYKLYGMGEEEIKIVEGEQRGKK